MQRGFDLHGCATDMKKTSFKLRTKLMASFLLVVSLAVVTIGMLFAYHTYSFSRREVERTSSSNLKSALDKTLDMALELRNESIRPMSNPREHRAIVDLLTLGNTAYENQFQLVMRLNSTRAIVDIHSLFFFGQEHTITTYSRSSDMSLEKMMEMPWFAQWYHSPRTNEWGQNDVLEGTSVVPYMRKIMEDGEIIGVSVLNISERAFQSCWNSYGNLVLIDEKDRVVSSRDKESLGDLFKEAYGVDLRGMKSGSSFSVTHEGIHYIAVLYRDEVYHFGMIELLPQTSIWTVVMETLGSALLTLALCVLLCILLSALLSVRITKPLKNVTEMVDRLKIDTPPSDMPVNSNDEIGMLISSINNMMRRVAASKEEIVRISQERRLAEYRAIQLQINPHFLYNTLSSICWFADKSQPENVKRVAESLSTLFRISVNHGQEMLHIVEELNHVRCYLDIQMLRHQGEFIYQIDVEPEILSFYTIKIILQPLVENALYHGIRENGIQDGIIRIEGRREGKNIWLSVMDNGNIPQSRIDWMNEALRNPDSRENMGIGMLNVHNRICYFYQNGYGLRYQKQGNLTVACMNLPVVEEI